MIFVHSEVTKFYVEQIKIVHGALSSSKRVSWTFYFSNTQENVYLLFKKVPVHENFLPAPKTK